MNGGTTTTTKNPTVAAPRRGSSRIIRRWAFHPVTGLLLFALGYQLCNLSSSPSSRTTTTSESSVSSFDLARTESYGFFDDIPKQEWELLQIKARQMAPNTMGDPRKGDMKPAKWFQNHYEPEFACRFERRIGRLGDGGKWICDPHRITQQERQDCLVYSVGSNGDASFEAAVQQNIGQHCEIHVFDFGNYTETVQKQAPGVHYHMWGLGKETNGKYKTLQDTIQLLGHTHKIIDIFKIDCEGCELTTFTQWFEANVTLRQILVEVHSQGKAPGTMKNPETMDMFDEFRNNGYVIFHKEPNIAYWIFGKCVEYAFIKLNPTFLFGGNTSSLSSSSPSET